MDMAMAMAMAMEARQIKRENGIISYENSKTY